MGHRELKHHAPPFPDLVAQARAGKTTAQSELILATKNRLYRFLVLLCKDVTLANDVLQDTYVYALEHLKELKEPAAFPRWLFMIARNRFLDLKRSAANRLSSPLESASELEASTSAVLSVEIRQALAALDEDERILLLLVDLEGYTYVEASEIIKISESAIRSRLHRARQAFHKAYFAR